MISFTGAPEIYLALKPCDLRKSFNGLYGLAEKLAERDKGREPRWPENLKVIIESVEIPEEVRANPDKSRFLPPSTPSKTSPLPFRYLSVACEFREVKITSSSDVSQTILRPHEDVRMNALCAFHLPSPPSAGFAPLADRPSRLERLPRPIRSLPPPSRACATGSAPASTSPTASSPPSPPCRPSATTSSSTPTSTSSPPPASATAWAASTISRSSPSSPSPKNAEGL